jgi:NSS family neurotransmitter:Na+ symporter
LGQAFFSLSLGAGAMLTYGSYLSKRDHIGRLSNTIVHTDTIVALVCSLFILPLSLDYRFANTPLFIFVTLSDYFGSLSAARLVGGVFFLCLSFVVLTMTISVMEPVVSYWIDQYKRKRHVAAIFTGVAVAFCSLPLILSFGASAELTNFIKASPNGDSKSFFDVVFDLFINVALPLGGLLTCLFVSKVWGANNFLQAVRGATPSESRDWFAPAIAFCLRFLTPALILILLAIKIYQVGSIYFLR